MKLKFYGVRGVYPWKQHMNCGLVTAPEGCFFIDMGACSIFAESSLIKEVDHVLLTHTHPDHIAMLASYIIGRSSLKMNRVIESGQCHFVCPESLREYMEFSGLGGLPNYDQADGVPAEWLGLKLSAMLTNHPKPNYCYKMQSADSTLVWTGDTSYSDELAEFCRGADVVVAESSFPDRNVKNALAWGHMTPQMTARLIENAQPRRLICSHFVELPGEEYVAAVRAHLTAPAEVEAAFDGFEIELP